MTDIGLCKKGECQQEKIVAVPSARKKTGVIEGTGAEVMLPLPKLRNGDQEGFEECFHSSDLFLVPVLPGQAELWLRAVAGLRPHNAWCGRWCGEKKVGEVIPLAAAPAAGQAAPSCPCSPRMAAAGHSWGQAATRQRRGWSVPLCLA